MRRYDILCPPEFDPNDQRYRASEYLGGLLVTSPHIDNEYAAISTGSGPRTAGEISGTEELSVVTHLAYADRYKNVRTEVLLELAGRQGVSEDPPSGERKGLIPDESRTSWMLRGLLANGLIRDADAVIGDRFTQVLGAGLLGQEWQRGKDLTLFDSLVTTPQFVVDASSLVESYANYTTRYAFGSSYDPDTSSPVGRYGGDAIRVFPKAISRSAGALMEAGGNLDSGFVATHRTNKHASPVQTPHNSGGFLRGRDGTPLNYGSGLIAPEVQAYTYEALMAILRMDDAIVRADSQYEQIALHNQFHMNILERNWRSVRPDRQTLESIAHDIQAATLDCFNESVPGHLLDKDPETGALRSSGIHGSNVARLLYGGILEVGDDSYIEAVVQMVCDELLCSVGLRTLAEIPLPYIDSHAFFATRPSHGFAVSSDLYEKGYRRFSREIDTRILCGLAAVGMNADVILADKKDHILLPTLDKRYGSGLPRYFLDAVPEEYASTAAGVIGAVERLRRPLQTTPRSHHDDKIMEDIERKDGVFSDRPDELVRHLVDGVRRFYPQPLPRRAKDFRFFVRPEQSWSDVPRLVP